MKYSIVINKSLNNDLKNHLIRKDGQEDLCFAFYTISNGKNRITGIINEIILPEMDDRNVHGNVSFNPQYLDKVIKSALEKQKGIVFIHSHPSSGWQGMSRDDVNTEKLLAPRVKAVTELPLIGMTIGTNGDWSARFWNKVMPKLYHCDWCESVRVVGENFTVTFNDQLKRPIMFSEELTRTISAWGTKKQNILSRLNVGVVGIGSVGSQICEALVRTGVQNICLVDFDQIENKNLDRLHGVSSCHVGYLKTDVYAKLLSENKLYESQIIESVPYSVVEEEGFNRLIDCDIIFSCVDKPWARFVLNCIAYSYLIPVIDGGIDASYNKKKENLDQARWRTYVAGPERICMKCMKQYKPEDVSLEQTGLLQDPKYVKGLEPEHFFNKGENVYAFSLSLAGLQMQQFLSLVLSPKSVNYGPKEMDFITGNIDFKFDNICESSCEMYQLLGTGDSNKNALISKHSYAEEMRNNALRYKISPAIKTNSFFGGAKNKLQTIFKKYIKNN